MSTEITEPAEIATPDFQGLLTQGRFAWGIVSDTGIVLRDEISQPTWEGLVENALNIWEYTGKKHCEITMKIGDLLRFGEEKWGEEYSQAVDDTRRFIHMNQKTLANAMWICSKVPASVRRTETLTLSHHEQVATLPIDEQRALLAQAENENMSVAELKKAIKETHPGKPRGGKTKISVKIDVDDPKAVADALNICALWIENREKDEDSAEHLTAMLDTMDRIGKAYRRLFRKQIAAAEKAA